MRRIRKAFVVIGITGIACIVLYSASLYLWFVPSTSYLAGDPWVTTARHWLIDVGVPRSFVYKYITFLLIHGPTWVLLFPIMAGLGASRYVWAKSAAIAIALWVPIIDFLGSIMIEFRVLFGVNTRVVPTLCGILVCFTGFYLGKCISMFSRKSRNDIRVEQGNQPDL